MEENEVKNDDLTLQDFITEKEEFFYLDESPIYQGKYLIRLKSEKLLFPNGTNGSYNVFISRVLNLTYPDYLRYARDRLGAELIGKNNKYVIAYFERTKEVNLFIRLINKRVKYLMLEHKCPYDIIKEEDGTIKKIPFVRNEDNG